MYPPFSDPHNHVPEVSPDDCWGDAVEASPGNSTLPAVLPERRTVTDRSSSAKVKPRESGLRIEANLTRGEATGSPQRLEVQEISGSVVRLDQAISAPLKVPRQVTFHEKPVRLKNPTKPNGEGSDWGFTQHRSTRWLLGAGVAVLVMIILPLILLPSINARNAPRINPDKGALRVEIEEKIEGMETLNLLLRKQPEALQIFRSYTHASCGDEILPLLRDGKALEEILRQHWRTQGISKSWTPAADSSWAVLELAGQPCGLLAGDFPDHSKFSAYFTNEGNRLQLDWKATTAYGTASFAELEKGQGDASEIRGQISSAEFYSAAWPEADYRSYRLVSPEGEALIWCYARRGEAAARVVARLFDKGDIVQETQTSQKITLRLEHGPAGAQPNQWLIGEVLHIDWVTP